MTCTCPGQILLAHLTGFNNTNCTTCKWNVLLFHLTFGLFFRSVNIIQHHIRIKTVSWCGHVMCFHRYRCTCNTKHRRLIKWKSKMKDQNGILSCRKAGTISLFSKTSKWMPSGQHPKHSLENLRNVLFFWESNLSCPYNFLVTS